MFHIFARQVNDFETHAYATTKHYLFSSYLVSLCLQDDDSDFLCALCLGIPWYAKKASVEVYFIFFVIVVPKKEKKKKKELKF